MRRISLLLILVLTFNLQPLTFNRISAAEVTKEGGVDVLYNWDFSKGGEDWVSCPVSNIGKAEIAAGALVLECNGYDPYIFSPAVDIDASRFTDIIIKMKMSTGAGDAIFFITEDDQKWDENKKAQAGFSGDGAWHEYKIDMSGSKYWKGKVTGFRIDPPNDGKPKCEIACIKIASKEKKFLCAAPVYTL